MDLVRLVTPQNIIAVWRWCLVIGVSFLPQRLPAAEGFAASVDFDLLGSSVTQICKVVAARNVRSSKDLLSPRESPAYRVDSNFFDPARLQTLSDDQMSVMRSKASSALQRNTLGRQRAISQLVAWYTTIAGEKLRKPSSRKRVHTYCDRSKAMRYTS